MTLVMNQLLDSKLIEANDEEENDNKSTEKQEDVAMVLWDCVSMFDTEKESGLRYEEISKANVKTSNQALVKEDNNQSKPPPHSPASMNLTEVGMDNFCTIHQQPHSIKNCPQWINSMTLVMNQLLDSKLTEADEEEKKQPTEKQEEDALVLWDRVSLFDTEEGGSLK